MQFFERFIHMDSLLLAALGLAAAACLVSAADIEHFELHLTPATQVTQ